MMDFVVEKIVEKWGGLAEGDRCFYNGDPVYLNNGLKFNYIFMPEAMERYEEWATSLGINIPDELKELYQKCNGFRLFLSSLTIYGLQNRENEMEPYDLAIENYNIVARMKANRCENKGYFFFGSYGRDYVFAFKEDVPNKVFCFKNGFDTVEMEFASIQELLEFFVPRIILKYDEDCNKDCLYKRFKQIPVLANALYDLDEILEKR